jgi:NAD(P)-dependent dehydrogenase (short-subunit alcohol dehydrogenase family)
MESSGDQYTFTDPRTQYAQPTIERDQKQPEPGLDRLMQPQADHGEETYRGTGRLAGRKALITGADSGIGRAVAIAYAREGADLVLSYLPVEQDDMDDLLDLLRETGRHIAVLPGDISNEPFCRELVDRAVKELGGIDLLINNAGKQIYVPDIADLSTTQIKATFAVNVFAPMWLSKHAIPHMPPGSSIINTSSVQGYHPSPGLLDYAATKAAIVNFTKGLAQQVADKGIRVNAVAPGPVWTPLQPSHGQPPEKLEHFGENTLWGRTAQPAELAPTYVYLASQESGFVTAEVIGVTGGGKILP